MLTGTAASSHPVLDMLLPLTGTQMTSQQQQLVQMSYLYLLLTSLISMIAALILIVPYTIYSLFSRALDQFTQTNEVWLRRSFWSSTVVVTCIFFLCLVIDFLHFYKGITGFDQEHKIFYIIALIVYVVVVLINFSTAAGLVCKLKEPVEGERIIQILLPPLFDSDNRLYVTCSA